MAFMIQPARAALFDQEIAKMREAVTVDVDGDSGLSTVTVDGPVADYKAKLAKAVIDKTVDSWRSAAMAAENDAVLTDAAKSLPHVLSKVQGVAGDLLSSVEIQTRPGAKKLARASEKIEGLVKKGEGLEGKFGVSSGWVTLSDFIGLRVLVKDWQSTGPEIMKRLGNLTVERDNVGALSNRLMREEVGWFVYLWFPELGHLAEVQVIHPVMAQVFKINSEYAHNGLEVPPVNDVLKDLTRGPNALKSGSTSIEVNGSKVEEKLQTLTTANKSDDILDKLHAVVPQGKTMTLEEVVKFHYAWKYVDKPNPLSSTTLPKAHEDQKLLALVTPKSVVAQVMDKLKGAKQWVKSVVGSWSK
jgi:hypothetical protein